MVEKTTALLASMIEEGFHNDEISQAVIHAYLEDSRFEGIRALVPACTHYPLIIDEIAAYFNDQVEILNAPDIIAQSVKQQLFENKMLSGSMDATMHFMVSDLTESFQKSATIFFGERVRLEEQRITN